MGDKLSGGTTIGGYLALHKGNITPQDVNIIDTGSGVIISNEERSNLAAAFNNMIVSASGNGNSVLTLNKQNGNNITLDLSHTHNYLSLNGGTITGTLTIGDNVNLYIGNSGDGRLYSDGSTSYFYTDLLEVYNELRINQSSSLTNVALTAQGDEDTGINFPSSNTIQFVTGASERMRIDSSGNIGINTNNPSKKLDVNGDLEANEIYEDGARVATQDWVNNQNYLTSITSSMVTSALGYTPLSTTGKAADADKLDGISSKSFLRSDTNDTMNGKLTISSSGTLDGADMTKYWLRIGSTFAFDPNEILIDDVGYIRTTGTNTLTLRGGNKNLELKTNGLFFDGNEIATQNWVNSQGYLTSINSSMITSTLGYTPFNPSDTLDTLKISNNIKLPTNSSSTTPTIHGTNDTNTGINLSNNDTLSFITNGSERIKIFSSGRVSIASSDENTYGNLYVAGSGASKGISIGSQTTSFRIYGKTDTNKAYITRAGSDTRGIIIDSNGNVGIRNDSPSANLDVNGDVNISGSLSVESIEAPGVWKNIRYRSDNSDLSSGIESGSDRYWECTESFSTGDKIMLEVADWYGTSWNQKILTVTLGRNTTTPSTTDDDGIVSWTTFNGSTLAIYSFAFSYSNNKFYAGSMKKLRGNFSGSTISWYTNETFTLYIGNIWKLVE